MKRILSTSLLCCCLFMTGAFISCSKQDSHKQGTLDLSGKVLTNMQFSVLADKISDLHERVLLKSCDTVQTEAEAQVILEPLIESGNSIYNEIIAHSAEIAPADFAAIANPTDQQLAELAVTYYAASQAGLTEAQKKVLTCLGTAIGIASLNDVFVGTGVTLFTAESATAILMAIAKRLCLGYVGTIIVIYGFLDCLGYLPA